MFVRPSSKRKSGILHRRAGAGMLRVWISVFDALVGSLWLMKAYSTIIFFRSGSAGVAISCAMCGAFDQPDIGLENE